MRGDPTGQAMRKRLERTSEAARERAADLLRAVDSSGLPEAAGRARDSALEAGSKATAAARRRSAPVREPACRGVALAAPYVAAGPALAAEGIGALTGACWEAIERLAGFVSRRIVPVAGRTLGWAERAFDPRRAALALALVGGIGLAGSQFLDFRGVSIGGALYGGQVALDAPPPLTAQELTGEANYWVPVALGIAVVACSVAAIGRSRPRLGLVVAALGGIGLVIALVIDLPRGLDESAARPYGAAQVLLLEGFWIQACASVLAILAGLGIDRTAPAPSSKVAARR